MKSRNSKTKHPKCSAYNQELPDMPSYYIIHNNYMEESSFSQLRGGGKN